MRIYIIGHDGITVCGAPSAAVNEDEIVVALNEELHAAELSGKRLLALWNALPSVEKRRKVGVVRKMVQPYLWHSSPISLAWRGSGWKMSAAPTCRDTHRVTV